MVNENIKQLQRLNFQVEDCKRVNQNVSQLWIIKRDGDVLRRECVFWIDISTRTCYIKKFKHISTVNGQYWGLENSQVAID